MSKGKKAVFLDRDGVINECMTVRVKFVNKPKDLILLPGAAEGIRLLNEGGYEVFVVTNQGGVGLGFMKEAMLQDIHEEMVKQLDVQGARIHDIAYCPHKPKDGCACRKPGPGMILTLAKKHGIDLSRSYMVGDMDTDIEAGQRAGLTTILIGPVRLSDREDYVAPDLKAVAGLILGTDKIQEIESNRGRSHE